MVAASSMEGYQAPTVADITIYIKMEDGQVEHTTSNTRFCAKIESKRELLRCDSKISNKSNPGIFI
jgi:hypothetical protein